MNTRTKQIVIAVVIGAVAVWANSAYIDSVRDEYRTKKVAVAVTKRPIESGSVLRGKDLKKEQIPKRYVPRAAVRWTDRANFVGQPVGVDVASGDYLLANYFAVRRAVGNKLSDQIEGENFRAVTLPVDQTNSFARSIVSGDLIDLVYTFVVPTIGSRMSVVLLQNVPVISTGTYSVAEHEIGSRGGAPKKFNTLTLRLTADDAARLTYARQNGKIDILLRNSSDSNTVDFKPIASVVDLLDADAKARIAQIQTESQVSGDQEQLRAQLKELFERERRQRSAR